MLHSWNESSLLHVLPLSSFQIFYNTLPFLLYFPPRSSSSPSSLSSPSPQLTSSLLLTLNCPVPTTLLPPHHHLWRPPLTPFFLHLSRPFCHPLLSATVLPSRPSLASEPIRRAAANEAAWAYITPLLIRSVCRLLWLLLACLQNLPLFHIVASLSLFNCMLTFTF